jgi:uncharacterized protein YggE
MEKRLMPDWMVRALGLLLIIFLALLIVHTAHTLNGAPQTRRITATGKMTAVPDLATVTIGVETQGADTVDIKNKNNQKINQIIAFIKQQGIADKDIKTTGFYASPRYNYTNGQNNIIGYQANQTITVHVHDVNKSQTQLEKIIDGAVNNGANEIQGIGFNFADADKFRQEARKQAIEKAKEKAEELASEANLKLGRVVNIIESSSDYVSPGPMAMANYSSRNKSVEPNIEPGSQDVIETISLIFEVY